MLLIAACYSGSERNDLLSSVSFFMPGMSFLRSIGFLKMANYGFLFDPTKFPKIGLHKESEFWNKSLRDGYC